MSVSVLAHKRGECYTLSTVNQSGFDDDEDGEEEAANGDAAAAASGDDGDAASAAGIRVKFEAYIYIINSTQSTYSKKDAPNVFELHPKYILKKGCPKRISTPPKVHTQKRMPQMHFRRTRRHRCAQEVDRTNF